MMNQRLKVMLVTASMWFGGAERLILDMAQRMDAAQVELHICAIGRFDENTLLSEFKKLHIPLRVIPNASLYNPRAVAAVWRYIRRHNIDVVHTHLMDGDIVGRIAGRLAGRPTVSTLHNICAQYNRHRWDRKQLGRLTARYLATRLVAVADFVGQSFVEGWNIPPERISTIYNATQIERFLAVEAGTGPGAAQTGLTVTTVGSLIPQKGHHILLQAAAQILQRRPGIRFLIVGEGELGPSLRQMAAGLGLAGRVTFTGLRNDIPQILARSDIFVLPSLWEGLPVSAIEAMAAARPVVLTDVGGNRELVEPDRHGLIVPPNNPGALAEALLALLNDPSRRLAMGHAARARAEQTFNFERFISQYQALYRAVALH
ncbi:MAG: glycosyltransferase [Anaerolineae bacterium]